MKKLASEGKTMAVVTHEIQFAREVADRVVFMDAGQIVEEGRPDAVIGVPRQDHTRLFPLRIPINLPDGCPAPVAGRSRVLVRSAHIFVAVAGERLYCPRRPAEQQRAELRRRCASFSSRTITN